jgi:hypothetical protein
VQLPQQRRSSLSQTVWVQDRPVRGSAIMLHTEQFLQDPATNSVATGKLSLAVASFRGALSVLLFQALSVAVDTPALNQGTARILAVEAPG